MARVRFGSWAFFIAIGAVLAVAVLPMSRWSFRNQVDMLLGRLPSTEPWNVESWLGTSGPLDPSRWRSETRDDELAAALFSWARRPSPSDQAREKREPGFRPLLQALESFVDKHPDDLDGCAHLARLLTQTVTVPRLDQRKGIVPRPFERQRESLAAARLLEVAAQGARLDPKNAYFPTMRAIALYTLDRKDEARDVLVSASGLGKHDDRFPGEAKLLVSTLEKNYGYRGQASRTIVAASSVLPHYSSERNLVERISSETPPEKRLSVRWALLRHQYVMARDASTLVGILVGRSGMGLALLPRQKVPALALGVPSSGSIPKGAKREEWEAKVARKARELGAALKSAGIDTGGLDPATMVDEVTRLAAAGADVAMSSTPDQMDMPGAAFRAAHLGARILALLLGLVPAYLVLSWWAKRDPPAFERGRGTLCCFLLGLSVFWLSLTTALDSERSMYAVAVWAALGLTLSYAVLLVMALRGTSERATLAVFGVAAAAGFLPFTSAVLSFTGATIIALANLVLLFLAWQTPKRWMAGTLLAVAATAGCLGVFKDPFFAAFGWGPMLLAVFPGACALCLGPARALRAVGSGVALLLTLAYLGATGWDVSEDAKYERVNATFFHEAEIARAKVGLPKLGAR